MGTSAGIVKVYLEAGAKRAFAGALDWPGWCRSGRDEESALRTLIAYGPRYAVALKRRKVTFTPPRDPSGIQVVERIDGDATTDFGAPSTSPASDDRPLDEAELERQTTILRACWATFDAAAKAASDKVLRKGPRGGGRELDAMVRHVLDADAGYLRRIGRIRPKTENQNTAVEMARVRREMLDGISSVARGEPLQRPRRSGTNWTPRYTVRRVAWHALDHAWEIEDRATSE